MQLSVATLTDPGKARTNNEDRAWAQVFNVSEGDPLALLIVCDGIGGHLAGEHASHWAVETIRHDLAAVFVPRDPRATVRLSNEELEAALRGSKATRKLSETEIEKKVRQAIEKANQVVYSYAQKKPQEARDAGSTVTLALLQGKLATLANVGDSRTYLLRDHRLRQITQDHSLVASLVASGQIQPNDIYTHPQRNVIYRSLGQKNKVQADVFTETLQAGDYLVLCTDGLWEMIRDPNYIIKMVDGADACDLAVACQRLVKAANDAGGEDNISVALARVDE